MHLYMQYSSETLYEIDDSCAEKRKKMNLKDFTTKRSQ